MAKSIRKLKDTLRQVRSCLNLVADTDDATFETSWGISRNQALKNLAKLCDESLSNNPPEVPSQAEAVIGVLPPAKVPDDFQITGVTDAQDDDRTFMGYKISDLRAAFEAVAPKDDWKGPIDAVINTGMFQITYAAVWFFTSTELRTVNPSKRSVQVRVTADGYRAGPAGDR